MTTRAFMLAVSCSLALAACLDSQEGQERDVTSPSQTDGYLQSGDGVPIDSAPMADNATAPDSALSGPDTRAPDPQCTSTGSACEADAACCSGICAYGGSYTFTIDPSLCTEPLALGDSCSRDHLCASGFCVNGVCAVGACLEADSDCSLDTQRCCYPTFCSWYTPYAPGYCTAPQPAGGYCRTATWCASGMCSDDGVCQ